MKNYKNKNEEKKKDFNCKNWQFTSNSLQQSKENNLYDDCTKK